MASQNRSFRYARVAFRSAVLILCVGLGAFGQEPAEREGAPRQPTVADELALRQSRLADSFSRMEKMMLLMAEYDSSDNPRRAALLRKALRQSKENHIGLQFETLSTLLNQKQFSRAVSNQEDLHDDLKELLELLRTENRPDRLKDEQRRLRDYIKELDRILRIQRSVQGRTEGGEDTNRLARDQEKVASRTKQLGDTMDQNEGGGSASRQPSDQSDGGAEDASNGGESEPKESDSKPDGESDDSDIDENDRGNRDTDAENSQPSSPQRSERNGSDSNGQPSQNQSPPEGNDAPRRTPSDGDNSGGNQQRGGRQQDAQPSDNATPSGPRQQESAPGRQRIAQAEQKMRDAEKRLAEADRDGAQEEQDVARRLLEEAKAELEEILRQMREEEVERVLAMLEGRFRKMLEMQLIVHEKTVKLDKARSEDASRQIDIEAGKLSLEQRRILSSADQALLVLREEGSSAAFPEVVEQMRDDMQDVVTRLGKGQVGGTTQALEEDVIVSLEEMIEALQQAQEDQQRRQQNRPPSNQQGEPQDQPLVDSIAELKLIKSLQLRINKRTQRYSKLLADIDDPAGQAEEQQLIRSLQALSEREKRIHRTTRDIVLGRNR